MISAKYIKTLLILIISFGIDLDMYCQDYFFQRKDSVNVIKSGSLLSHAWSGGWNNPQFSEIDVDMDGNMDLYVFDRSSYKSTVFKWNGNPANDYYIHAPEYDSIFPVIDNFGLMIDFDNDGDKDLFAYAIGGIKVFENLAVPSGNIEFKLINEQIKYNTGTNYINIYVTSVDIPGFGDIDNDGDIDILTFDILGGFVDYYKNTSMENHGHSDSLEYIKSSDCWGLFVEPGLSNILVLDYCNANQKLSNPFTGGGYRHAGSTMLVFNPDGDSDMDILLGDLSFNNLVYGENIPMGNIDSIATMDTLYPAYDVSADVLVFPAAFELDIDHDGKKDLMVAPNANSGINSVQSSWFYKNTGTATSSVYSFVESDFLQNSMIDHGERSNPAFVDYNGDALYDLVVGNYGKYENNDYKASLSLWENTGTATKPEFTLITDDWLSIKSMDLTDISPAFGDLDGDGDTDLILGDADGKLHYFENNAGAGSPVNLVLTLPNYQGIDIGQFAKPTLYDLNNDGLLDLVIGKKTGLLSYYENKGTASSPAFILKSDTLGMVDVKMPAYNTGYSAPHFAALDNTGEVVLLVSSQSGYVYVYDISQPLSSTYSCLDTLVMYEGRNSCISSAHLDMDSKLDMVMGAQRGGLALFEYTDSLPIYVDLIENKGSVIDVEVFPNPVQGSLNIRSEERITKLQIFDMYGREVFDQEGYDIKNISIPSLSYGIYNIRLYAGERFNVLKFVSELR